MGAILNGWTVHGGFRAFGATFFVFSDYMRPAVRLACAPGPARDLRLDARLDRAGRGRPDAPADRALASLRAILNLRFVRPADATETVEAWRFALTRQDGPTALALTRQKLPDARSRAARARKRPAPRRPTSWQDADGGAPEVILIGTGSEVQLALGCARARSPNGRAASRVVSRTVHRAVPRAGRRAIATPSCPPTSGAACRSRPAWRSAGPGWSATAGARSRLDRYGASAPAPVIYEHLGITSEAVVAAARELLAEA